MKFGVRARVRARFPAVLLAAWLLGGCTTSGRTTIEANDAVVMPELRVSLLTSGSGRPAEMRTGYAIELGASGAHGTDLQPLAAGQPPVVHGGQTFNAPDQLEHRFGYKFYSAVLRWRSYYPENGWGMELFAGPAGAGLDFRVSSPARDATTSETSAGIVLGLGLIKELQPGTSLQLRLSTYGSADIGIDSAERFELALVQVLAAHLSARAGYTRWRIYAEHRVGDSDIKLKLDAFTLGLDLHF